LICEGYPAQWFIAITWQERLITAEAAFSVRMRFF
jgi:hypothetical protein